MGYPLNAKSPNPPPPLPCIINCTGPGELWLPEDSEAAAYHAVHSAFIKSLREFWISFERCVSLLETEGLKQRPLTAFVEGCLIHK